MKNRWRPLTCYEVTWWECSLWWNRMFFKSCNMNLVNVPDISINCFTEQFLYSRKGGEMKISCRFVSVTAMDARSRASIISNQEHWLFWYRIANPKQLGPWLGYLRCIQMKKELFELPRSSQSTTYFSGQPTKWCHLSFPVKAILLQEKS